MTISSTEFQQNVGYYIDLVEKGEDIFVERRRPYGFVFKLTPVKSGQANNLKIQKIDYAKKNNSNLRNTDKAFYVNDAINNAVNTKVKKVRKKMTMLEKIKNIRADFSIDNPLAYQKFYRR